MLSFYASTAGVESATLLAFNLEEEASGSGSGSGSGSVPGEGLATATEQSAGPVLASATTGMFQQVAQFLNLNGSALDLVAPLFTVTVIGGEFDGGSAGGGGTALLASFSPVTISATVGQAVLPHADEPGDDAAQSAQAPTTSDSEILRENGTPLPVWERISMGLEHAWEQMRSAVIEKEAARPDIAAPTEKSPDEPRTAKPVRGGSSHDDAPAREQHTDPESRSDTGIMGKAIEDLVAEQSAGGRSPYEPSAALDEIVAIHRDRLRGPIAVAVASTAVIGKNVQSARFHRDRSRKPRSADEPSER